MVSSATWEASTLPHSPLGIYIYIYISLCKFMHTHVYIYRFILLMEKSAILFNVHLDGSAVLGAGPS